MKRENFGSRLGFILVSAGCAIGLGNVWKFPYMAGQYGGAAFILIYLLFLVILGLPIIVCEFSVGRASQKSIASSCGSSAACAGTKLPGITTATVRTPASSLLITLPAINLFLPFLIILSGYYHLSLYHFLLIYDVLFLFFSSIFIIFTSFSINHFVISPSF